MIDVKYLPFEVLISGRMPITQAIIVRWSPCVTPSLLCRKLAVPFLLQKTNDDQWRYQFKKKRALDGHKWRTVHSIMILLFLLNAYFESLSKKPQSSVVDYSSQIAWTPWTAPSILTLSPACSWSSWHSMVASGNFTFITILEKRCLQVSPTPTRCTEGCLPSAIIRPDINAWKATQGGLPLASQSTKVSTLIHSIFLSSPNFKMHPCRAPEYVPPGPEYPESFGATNLIESSMMSTGIQIGILSYVSNVAQEGTFFCGCFPSKTNATFLLIITVHFSANFSGWKTPQFPLHRKIWLPRTIFLSIWGSRT